MAIVDFGQAKPWVLSSLPSLHPDGACLPRWVITTRHETSNLTLAKASGAVVPPPVNITILLDDNLVLWQVRLREVHCLLELLHVHIAAQQHGLQLPKDGTGCPCCAAASLTA
jgi:hypothetical protein